MLDFVQITMGIILLTGMLLLYIIIKRAIRERSANNIDIEIKGKKGKEFRLKIRPAKKT